MRTRHPVRIACLVLLGLLAGCGQTETSHSAGTVVEGWRMFKGGGAELWLPASYEGGDLSKDLDVIVERVRALGPDYEAIARTMERNRSAFVIWAFDPQIGESGGVTNVTVVSERVPSSVTLETYLGLVRKKLTKDFRVVEEGVVPLASYQAGRVVLEANLGGTRIKQVMYMVKSGSTVWVVNLATGADEFDQRSPAFESSVRNIRVHESRLWERLRDRLLARVGWK
ncbi:MAG: hypothetical protein ACREIE_00540 [Nitrospiraceae bacterium]